MNDKIYEKKIQRVRDNDRELTNLDLGAKYCNINELLNLVDSLESNTELTEIDFSRCNLDIIEEEGKEARLEILAKLAAALASHPKLRSINLFSSMNSPEGIEAMAPYLMGSNSVNSINLCGNTIGTTGAQVLAAGLATNTNMKEINLSFTGLEAEGGKAIAEALKTNKNLVHLNLRGNKLGDKGAEDIAEALKTNKNLVHLNLGGNKLGDKGAEAIAEALKTNKNLVHLELGDNELGDKGAEDIAEALKTNKSLVHLGLRDNKLGDKGAEDIAEALKTNKNLVTLELGDNELGDKGAEDIAEALKTNKNLVTLDLGSNKLGDKGAEDIAEALKTNSSLRDIDLRDNSITTVGIEGLALALAGNISLTNIDYINSKMPEEHLGIEKYLARNRRIPEQLSKAKKAVKKISLNPEEKMIEPFNAAVKILGDELAGITVNSTGYCLLERECNSLFMEASLRQGDVKSALEAFSVCPNVNPDLYNSLAEALLSQDVLNMADRSKDSISSQIPFKNLEEKLSVLLALLLKHRRFNDIDQALLRNCARIANSSKEPLSPALKYLWAELIRRAEEPSMQVDEAETLLNQPIGLAAFMENCPVEQQDEIQAFYNKLPQALQALYEYLFPKLEVSSLSIFENTDGNTDTSPPVPEAKP